MELEHLPVIDWESGLKVAGNKKDLAEEILSALLKTLPSEVAYIHQCFQTKNYTDALFRVHKLHGAVCYSGLPRLKKLLARLETDLKTNIINSSPILLDQLNIELNLILKTCPRHLLAGFSIEKSPV